ncbi:MAG: hypothetical protein Q9225_005401 [Loekoesia sp. 1 TL-2023]
MMSIQSCPLLNLPWPPFRQIIDAVAVLDDPLALSVVVHLRRVCRRFDHELTNTIFTQKLARIREGNTYVAHIFPLIRRKILEGAAVGTLDASGLKSAIISVAHSPQSEHRVLRALDQDAIFSIFFDAAVDYRGPDEAVSNLFKLETPVFDPKQTRAHTLVIAAYLGEMQVVQSLLSQGADPNDLSICFGFALSAAARRGRPSIVKLLLDHGADVHTSGRFRHDAHFLRTAIVAAAEAGHENIIRILMEPKYKHPTSGRVYYHAIMTLVEGKCRASVFLLLDGATFDELDSIHQDILHVASANGCLPLVKAMVERGADVNGYADEICNQRPLELAARGGHEDVVSYLLASGAKQAERAAPLWDDAITAAAAKGHIGTLKILLQHGADINSRFGQFGTTPVHEAARYNRVDTVRFLLDKGAVLDVMQDDMVIFLGYEALRRAIKKGHKEIVRALAEGAVDVKSVAPDCTDNSPPPIILAKMWGHDDIVKLLLELGAEDVDLLETRWADEFRKGMYPKSPWTLRTRRSG